MGEFALQLVKETLVECVLECDPCERETLWIPALGDFAEQFVEIIQAASVRRKDFQGSTPCDSWIGDLVQFSRVRM